MRYRIRVDKGRILWIKKHSYHREYGPALEYVNGGRVWFKNILLHRLDGPAIEYANGCKEWWINHIKYSEEEFNKSGKK